MHTCTPVRTVYIISVSNTTNNTNPLQSWCYGTRRSAPAWDIQSCATTQASPSHRQDFPHVAYNFCKCTTRNPSPPKETWRHTFIPPSLHVSQLGKAKWKEWVKRAEYCGCKWHVWEAFWWSWKPINCLKNVSVTIGPDAASPCAQHLLLLFPVLSHA
jgi:hypothetical protein